MGLKDVYVGAKIVESHANQKSSESPWKMNFLENNVYFKLSFHRNQFVFQLHF